MIISIGHMNEISTDIYFFTGIRDERGGGGANYKFIVQLCAR